MNDVTTGLDHGISASPLKMASVSNQADSRISLRDQQIGKLNVYDYSMSSTYLLRPCAFNSFLTQDSKPQRGANKGLG